MKNIFILNHPHSNPIRHRERAITVIAMTSLTQVLRQRQKVKRIAGQASRTLAIRSAVDGWVAR